MAARRRFFQDTPWQAPSSIYIAYLKVFDFDHCADAFDDPHETQSSQVADRFDENFSKLYEKASHIGGCPYIFQQVIGDFYMT